MDILLIFNNYGHDLLTGLLLAAGFCMMITRKVYLKYQTKEGINFYIELFQAYNRLAKWSLIGLLLAGILRMMVFKQYEFIPAVHKGLLVALAIKHIFLFTAVLIGVFWWRKLAKEVSDHQKTRKIM